MNRIPASVFILTRNSDATLSRALESVQECDDIVICDGGSTDGTLDLARAAGARVFPQSSACLAEGRIRDFACARNACLAHVRYPWVLFIDSDESASPGLVAEIGEFLAGNPAPGICRIPAGIMLDGKLVRHSSNYPGYQVRFFHKEAGIFEKPVHERFIPNRKAQSHTFKHPWHYYVETSAIGAEFAADIVRDMALYEARYAVASRMGKCRAFMQIGKTMCAILLRGLMNNVAHRSDSPYPLQLEWLRIRYQWEILKTLARSFA